jgi:hypothetical protein
LRFFLARGGSKNKNRPGDFAPGRFFFANAQAKLGWTAAFAASSSGRRDVVNSVSLLANQET